MLSADFQKARELTHQIFRPALGVQNRYSFCFLLQGRWGKRAFFLQSLQKMTPF